MHRKISSWLVFLALATALVSCQQGKENDERAQKLSKQYLIDTNLIAIYDVAQKVNRKGSVELVEGIIRQTAHTALNYYSKLPADSVLHFKVTIPEKSLQGVIKVSTDAAEPEVFEFQKSGVYDLELAHLGGKIVEISLQAQALEPLSTDALEWANVTILTEKKLSDAESATEVQIRELNERVKGYDVVYLLFDAFDAKHSSLYGYSRETTPFFEELAKEAVVFENMFANIPYTLTSTATLVTSKYPDSHGLIHLTDSLHPVIPTIGELLENEDVETYLVTRHGYLLGDWGLSRGFSTIYQEHDKTDLEGALYALNSIYTKDREKRKFIYLHLNMPHTPYNPPEEFRRFLPELTDENAVNISTSNLKEISRGNVHITEAQLEHIVAWYDSNILYADAIARQVFELLKSQIVLENTIFIITSDHGEAFLQHERMLHGTTLFDEMTHIPFIIRFPKELALPSRRINHLASLVDVAPTLAAIMELMKEKQTSPE